MMKTERHGSGRRLLLWGGLAAPVAAAGLFVTAGGTLANAAVPPAPVAAARATDVPSVTAVTVDPTQVTGGQSAVLIVKLSDRAPKGGTVVTLFNSGGKGITDITATGCSSSNGCTTPPPPTTLTVRAGHRDARYTITTEPVVAATPFLLSAYTSNTGGGIFTGGPYALFTVTPAAQHATAAS